jgi:ATP-dependent Clp protease ATP-binding subunit ClpC
MLSILKHGDNIASKVLSEFDINYESYKSELEYVIQEETGQLPGISQPGTIRS